MKSSPESILKHFYDLKKQAVYLLFLSVFPFLPPVGNH